jgi:hypothetical protein
MAFLAFDVRYKTHTASIMLLVRLVQTLGKSVLHLAILLKYRARGVSIVEQTRMSKQNNWGQIPIKS